MNKRIISLVLCLSMLIGISPLGAVVALSTDGNSDEFVNYGADIGNTAEINDYFPIPITDDPKKVNNPWGTECEFVSETDVPSGLLLVITNYYLSAKGDLWYKVTAAPSHTLPQKLQEYPWIYQDNVNRPLGESITIHNTAVNAVFDADGNSVSSVVMSAYDEVELTCGTSLQGKIDYQWQIKIDDEWIDIYGQTRQKITVTAGLLVNAFEDEFEADIRCITKSGSKSVVGEAIRIKMEPYVQTESYALRSAYNATPAAEDDEYRYITVRYLFENGEEAANPFVAKVLKNEALSVTVDFPTVQGYKPYYQEERQDSLIIDEVVGTENITYTVYYKPTDVEYHIDVYFQNVEDDGYTFQSTETLTGLTGSKVPLKTATYEGMYELLHDTPTIAANGSTRIEVRFNRLYYITRIELDGGYGVYSTYARYGTKLSDNIGTPIRPGYSFVGWDDISSGTGDGIADVLPDTVPAEDRVYKAIWKENPTAEVRIAFWGENPNDESYSYIESQVLEVKPGTVLTYGTGGYICGLQQHTHGSGCTYICGIEAHAHSIESNCYKLNCEVKDHNHTTSGCTIKCTHTHDWSCLFGCNHSHTDACYTCGKTSASHKHSLDEGCYVLDCSKSLHTHTAECYACIQHQHSDSCRINNFEGYDSSKWTLVKSDTVTVAADGSTVMNVYFDRTYFTMTFKKEGSNGATLGTIYDKWGADIRVRFKEISEKNTFFWSEKQNGGSPWTSFMDVMPAKNMTYYADSQSGSTTHTARYYGQMLNSNEYEELYAVTLKGGSSITVTKEEFVEIEGFEFNDSKSTDTGSKFNGAKFYYDRLSFNLEFYSGASCVRTESLLYEESFAQFQNYTPEFPDEYEKGSRRFVGWYLNPECTGQQVNLSEMKMPAANMTLYAKWELVTHEVNIYKEKHDDGTFGESVLPDGQQPDPVLHGHKVFQQDFTLPIPENKPYEFVGWFYMDGDTEKMWDFEHSVVVRDTDIYAKWSAEVLVPYTVRYVVQNSDGTKTQIAETTEGSALAGTTVTFNAKVSAELYEGYREGYFPLTPSHSLTMDVTQSETGMFYDFVYVAKDKVPYTVRYVDENGKDLISPKVVANNVYAIVTEKFVYIQDYSPDKYQKTLVLNGTDGAVNEIVFYYKKDNTLGVYNVTHYVRSTDGESYVEHTSYGDIGTIGEVIKVDPLRLKGFTYDHAIVNGAATNLTDGTVNGTIIREGLEIKLYYERNKYPYKIQYLDKDTLAVLKSPDVITPGEYYGRVVTATNPPSIENYTLSSISSCVIGEDDAENPINNVINVYYSEKTVRINYEVVGPDDCGYVNPTYTDVKVLSGTGASSTATANEGYRFVGWYSDRDCTQLVTSNASLFLTIPNDKVWKAATYYAKFEPLASDLTIVRTNATDVSQVYVYEVKNNATGEIYYATIVGNGTATIKQLPMGEYTITQQNDWSWRHDDSAQSITHASADGTTVVFSGDIKKDQWLNGNSPLEKNQRG
ncbi:MAG: InlB B-repeat-containing protein [Clostridia bacterium]|nr:InlB B-repeat-containing protein [Clostridia bacterium]